MEQKFIAILLKLKRLIVLLLNLKLSIYHVYLRWYKVIANNNMHDPLKLCLSSKLRIFKRWCTNKHGIKHYLKKIALISLKTK